MGQMLRIHFNKFFNNKKTPNLQRNSVELELYKYIKGTLALALLAIIKVEWLFILKRINFKILFVLKKISLVFSDIDKLNKTTTNNQNAVGPISSLLWFDVAEGRSRQM